MKKDGNHINWLKYKAEGVQGPEAEEWHRSSSIESKAVRGSTRSFPPK